MGIIISYLIIINIIGFSIMGIDKKRAIHGEWRIPEHTLFSIALIFGALGTTAGMRFFRHKTLHYKFTIGMPLILAIQIFILLSLYIKK